MSTEKKCSVLFLEDSRSEFDSKTKALDELFENVDVTPANEGAIRQIYDSKYDIVIGDLSVAIQGLTLLKQIKDMRKEAAIFALVSPKDTDKLYKISELGIHAFELLPEQFDLALERIAEFKSCR